MLDGNVHSPTLLVGGHCEDPVGEENRPHQLLYQEHLWSRHHDHRDTSPATTNYCSRVELLNPLLFKSNKTRGAWAQ